MLKFIKLAWRNILRNKRRTFIAGIAIGMGLTALIFYDAIMIGMEENMVRTATSSFIGQAQIHEEGYRKTREVEKTINNLDSVTARLSRDPLVSEFSQRVMSFAMISSAGNATQVQLVGVDPESERGLSVFDEAIVKGDYLSGEKKRELVIGRKLADILEVEMGDRVVITTAQAETGDLSQQMLRVSGIFEYGDRSMDAGLALIPIEKAREMLNIEGAHEIALHFEEISHSENDTLPFWSRYSTHGNEAISWTGIVPQLDAAFDMAGFAKWIVGLILFGIVALVIINTLFMSLHERMFEFGVMKAIGTSPFKICFLMVMEAAMLAVVSIVIGSILALGVNLILGEVGIDYRGMEFLGTTINDLIYPVIQADQFIIYPLWLFFLTALVGLYPALHAARMSPAEAMQKTM